MTKNITNFIIEIFLNFLKHIGTFLIIYFSGLILAEFNTENSIYHNVFERAYLDFIDAPGLFWLAGLVYIAIYCIVLILKAIYYHNKHEEKNYLTKLSIAVVVLILIVAYFNFIIFQYHALLI